MTSFLLMVALLWAGGVVFVAVCMAIVKFLNLIEGNYYD